ADDDRHRQVDHVPAEQERLELLEHRSDLRVETVRYAARRAGVLPPQDAVRDRGHVDNGDDP
ncbi:MAG: hypothetical protein WKF93_02270, partial [Acidimicrobiales bacterium]